MSVGEPVIKTLRLPEISGFWTLAIDHLVAYIALTSTKFRESGSNGFTPQSEAALTFDNYGDAERKKERSSSVFISPEGEENLRNPTTLLSFIAQTIFALIHLSDTYAYSLLLSVFEQ